MRVRPFRRPEARLAGAIAIAAVLAACGGDPDAGGGPDVTPRPDAAPPASGLAARVRLLYVAASDCAPIGAIAHELGHGFALAHCEGACDAWGSIMWNWTAYDRRATLDDAERAALAVSPFFLRR